MPFYFFVMFLINISFTTSVNVIFGLPQPFLCYIYIYFFVGGGGVGGWEGSNSEPPTVATDPQIMLKCLIVRSNILLRMH